MAKATGWLVVTALILSGASARAESRMDGWWKSSVFYEVFVRSFQDSASDGIGDLKGVASRLDYIGSSLGADAIWLTPVFPSPSYHGYDATDYRGIHPELGSAGDMAALLAAAHSRG